MHCNDDFALDGSDLTLTLDQVNKLLGRFFGITLTEAQALDDIYYSVSGSAIVRPYKYDNKDTYQLIRMDVGEKE